MTTDQNCTSSRQCLCSETAPAPFVLVIFGASGDLTYRKLIPSLFNLFQRDLLPDKFSIVGCARTVMDDKAFRKLVSDSIREKFKNIPSKMIEVFCEGVFYTHGNYDSDETYSALSSKISDVESRHSGFAGRIFYLSVPSTIYSEIVRKLASSGLSPEPSEGQPYRRVIIEKPFGRDLQSSRQLEKELKEHLLERQIYRIDHYLGKDTVQNILMLRFANMIFEPLWNNKYIDNVQITVAESIGIEHRAGYFDKSGLLRDMFQNHMLEMLSLVAMEPPSSFDADRVRDEKLKLLSSIKAWEPDKISTEFVRAQYREAIVDGNKQQSYTEEDAVPKDSKTETFVAARLFINNWRWNGVPFYLRAGKRLRRRVSEIAVTFKNIPHSIFKPLMPEDIHQNTLVLNVQPEEGFALSIQAKKPGGKLCMGDLPMHFSYRDFFQGEPPDAYERLLLDCMLGDSTLFIRNDTIDISWTLLTPILERWAEDPSIPLASYPCGSWGPLEADAMIGKDGRKWRAP